MWTQGALSHELLLSMLQRGEVLPDVDIEAEIEKIESNKLNDLDLTAAGGLEPQDEESEAPADEEGGDSEVRQEVIRRLKRLAENDEEDDEEDS